MKILHLIETLGLGGAEKTLYTTLNAMNQKKGFELMACCLFKAGPIASSLKQAGIPVVNIDMNSQYDWRKGIFKLVEIVKENKIDIIHTHLLYANIYGRVAGWLSGVKAIVTTLHNPDYTYEDNGRISFKIRKQIDKYTGRMFNRNFLAVSYAVKKDYEKHLGFKGIDVLYNSIDPQEFAINPLLDVQAERKILGLKNDDFVLLNIGRLHHQKGQVYLLEAMKILVKKDPRFKLLIAGTGHLREKLSYEIEQNRLTENVFLLGERKDVINLLQLSDAFVFPSIYEAFGVAVAEAMAMEKIVVVSDIEGLREVAGSSGVYVRAEDAGDMAEAILHVSRNIRDYDIMKKEARRRVIDLFSVEKNINRLEEVYLRSIRII